jgi:Cu-Zn family superoxide dismutase
VLAALAAFPLALAACKSDAHDDHDHDHGRADGGMRATARIEGRSGSKLTGSASFTETKGGVQVEVLVENAPPGLHAVHLHEIGDCSAADATSAGAHFNPGMHPHGAPDAPAHHAGDFGNMSVGADGRGRLSLWDPELTVRPGKYSVVGRAIIVHDKPDDMTTQPTGNAGGRIGCGVVQ